MGEGEQKERRCMPGVGCEPVIGTAKFIARMEQSLNDHIAQLNSLVVQIKEFADKIDGLTRTVRDSHYVAQEAKEAAKALLSEQESLAVLVDCKFRDHETNAAGLHCQEAAADKKEHLLLRACAGVFVVWLGVLSALITICHAEAAVNALKKWALG